MIIVYCDGLCQPTNPGGIGTWAYTIAFDDISLHRYGVLGEGSTNQMAEYKAIVEALRKLIENGWNTEETILYTDSEMAVGQLMGHKKANRGEYLALFFEAKDLMERFSNLKLQWVPREENQEADRLTRVAYEKYCQKKGRKVKYNRGRGLRP